MRAVDVRNLVRFNTRMSMYICPSDRSGVVAFLHGYEYGAGGECRFTAVLSEHLAKPIDLDVLLHERLSRRAALGVGCSVVGTILLVV